MKEYMKPDLEMISLMAEEAIADDTDLGIGGGDMDLTSDFPGDW